MYNTNTDFSDQTMFDEHDQMTGILNGSIIEQVAKAVVVALSSLVRIWGKV